LKLSTTRTIVLAVLIESVFGGDEAKTTPATVRITATA